MSGPVDLLLQESDVTAFSEATGDVNPLHVSKEFARRTPYGRPIAHGALVALVALTAQPPTAALPGPLTVQFRRPVFSGRRYVVEPARVRADGWLLHVTDGGVPAVIVRMRPRSAREHTSTATVRPGDGSGTSTWDDIYHLLRPDLLRTVLRQWGDRPPEAMFLPLCWASWFTGMVMPGRDALLSQIVASGLGGGEVASWQARLIRDDARFDGVAVTAELSVGADVVTVGVESFRRPSTPDVTSRPTPRPAADSSRLDGQHVLVVGGSRGIGAGLSAALVDHGAVVHLAYAQSTTQAERLREALGAERVHLVQMDATDPSSVASAFEQMRRVVNKLDGIILCAAPALQPLPLHPDTAQEALEHVQAAVAMTWLPLAFARSLLTTGAGWVVFLSSSALEDPPAQWSHYVSAKGALEGLARSVASREGLPVLVVRPPRVWTDLTNSPGAARGALLPQHVAQAILRWVLGRPFASPDPLVLEAADFLLGRE